MCREVGMTEYVFQAGRRIKLHISGAALKHQLLMFDKCILMSMHADSIGIGCHFALFYLIKGF